MSNRFGNVNKHMIYLVGSGWNTPINIMFGKARLNSAIDKSLDKVSSYAVEILKKNIVQRGTILGEAFTPNAPLTIKIKGHGRPLIDTNGMMGAIIHKKIDNAAHFVGIMQEPYAGRARFLENGGIANIDDRTVFVPKRPFMSPFLTHKTSLKRIDGLFAASMMHELMI